MAAPSHAQVAARVALCALCAVLVESAAMLVDGPALPAGDRLWDLVLRTERLAVLATPVLMVALVWRLLAARRERVAAAGAWIERQRARLCVPARALRLLVLYLVAVVVCWKTLASHYQLAWVVGSAFATVPLAALAVGELAVEVWRGRAAPAVASPVGGIAWAVLLAVLALVVLSRLEGTNALVALTFAGAAWFAPLALRSRRLTLATLAGFVLVAGLGLAVEHGRPGLRRLVGVTTPWSAVGLDLLLWTTDLDRDGSSGAFGMDCDDLDPDRYPRAVDLPDDGLDQNCTGADGSSARAAERFAPGGAHAPRAPGPPPARRPDVVIVSVDAWRADALSAELMPETWAWAEAGWRFTTARTSANFTSVSVTALMTGLQPRHLLRGDAVVMTPGNARLGKPSTPPTLASVLSLAGWTTFAIVPMLDPPPWIFTGFMAVRGSRPARYPAEAVLVAARETWTVGPADRPRFLWVHLLDLHMPYLTGDGIGWTHAAYLRAVRVLDAKLAAFLRELPAGAIVVLTADHGEAFGEHGTYTHGHTLFDEEVRVPLVIRVPTELGGGARTIESPVGLADVMPTLIDLLGVASPYPRHGQTLLPLVREGAPLGYPYQVMESSQRDSHLQALQDGCWKWIRDLDREWEGLFQTCADPGEHHDLAPSDAAQLAHMRGVYYEILDQDLDAYRTWR